MEPEMVETFPPGAPAVHDVAQTLPAGQLRVGHAQELIPTRELLDLVLAPKPVDATRELLRMDRSHQLAEDGLSGVHAASFVAVVKRGKQDVPTSNRSHAQSGATCPSSGHWKSAEIQPPDRSGSGDIFLSFAAKNTTICLKCDGP
jgi:hypothetical protein